MHGIDGTNAPEHIRPDVRFAFILAPEFTLTPFAVFLDSIRHAADELDGSRQYYCHWTCIGPNFTPVVSSCGVEITPWKIFDDPSRYDYIVVVGGLLRSFDQTHRSIFEYLKKARSGNVSIVGLCTGGFVLAGTEMMDGHRCAVHIDHEAAMVDMYPDVIPVTNEMYVFDRGFITCPGGTAAIDLAVDILSQHCGRSRGMKGITALVVDEHRTAISARRVPFQELEYCGDWRVEQAVRIMRQGLSDPKSISLLSDKLATSRRQLDRSFKDVVGKSPTVFWREMRLDHARWRLMNTSRTVTEIAYECGFADCAHFVRWFKRRYGETPTGYRKLNTKS